MRDTPVQGPPPTMRFAAVGVLAAAAMMVAVLLPRRSDAAMLQEVLQAVKSKLERSETCYTVHRDGRWTLSYQAWSKPGKSAMRFADGGDIRDNGKESYIYYPSSPNQAQSIGPSSGDGLDPVGVEEYVTSPYGKLLRVEREAGANRFVFQMGETRQDLIIDDSTRLPKRRDVFTTTGKLMEVHEYQFSTGLDDGIFDPDIKPGVPVFRKDSKPASGSAAKQQ
ncbi:MAG: hypothetical protein JSS65_05780 [Armatimonadetes bacterium]|nr:hypothetical protein [Armatimonadota bacterium]